MTTTQQVRDGMTVTQRSTTMGVTHYDVAFTTGRVNGCHPAPFVVSHSTSVEHGEFFGSYETGLSGRTLDEVLDKLAGWVAGWST